MSKSHTKTHDMSESKGISLRRKKTTAARPRPTISGPINSTTSASASSISLQQSREPSVSRNNSTWTVGSHDTTSQSRSRERPRLGGETSELVKRRYSTRFAGGIPQDGPAPPPPMPAMPAMPVMPAQYAGIMARSDTDTARPSTSKGRHASPERERVKGKLQVDMRALKDPNLQAEKYVQSVLGDATEQDIIAYQTDLQNIKQLTEADLQHNVYQNRTQFIKISKEADKLKTEMRTLQSHMTELTSALGHATSAGGADINSAGRLSLADRKRANRSSVANLEAMWTTHLQTLWKRVEGSQKYLPAIPGRHILLESQRWVELNAATWKPRRRVAIVLLNDHLLVASEKKRPAETTPQKSNRQSMYGGPQASTTTLVADRCWQLHEVALADISTRSSTGMGHNNTKENKNIANAISVRAGSDSLTYATSDSGDKLNLIVQFRKAQEDQRKQLAAEHASRTKDADSFAALTGRDPRSLKKAAAAAAESETAEGFGGLSRSNSVLVDVDGRPQSVRWVESQIDGLDIDIALQRFEEAVETAEKLRKMARGIKSNQPAQEIIQAKVNERASKLANSIARQLSHTSGGMEKTKENVSWLIRLGFEELARTTYLNSRKATITLRSRQVMFSGDLVPYVQALSYIVFTLVLHTFQTFYAAFPPTSGSAVVKWAKERIDEFNASLGRQLSTVNTESEMYKACVAAVTEKASVLQEVNVDYRGLVSRDLQVDQSPNAVSDAAPVGLGVSGA